MGSKSIIKMREHKMNREELLFSVRSVARSLDVQAAVQLIRGAHPADVAEAMEVLSTEEVLRVLQLLDQRSRADLFTHFAVDRQDTFLRAMTRDAVVQLFECMPSDDRADLFNRLSDEAKQKLLPALAKVERDDILKLASYPEGTVGSVTTSDYVHVAPAMTVAEALAHVRATAPDKERRCQAPSATAESLKGVAGLGELFQHG
uniref:magnesium transporter MgtE N-terminal domain-containing protein n=1 Tax=Tepidimonas taiwanensis TaxID=307486 RepID=UPI001F2B1DD1